jgi:CSLREA domain-containing protein
MPFRLARISVAAVAGLALTAPAALATTIKVTTTADTLASGSGCSLRAAVIASNTDAATGGCKAGSGADVIKLAKGATYALSIAAAPRDTPETGDLDVTAPVTIKGHGSTIDARRLYSVIQVSEGTSLKLSDATLTGGVGANAGAALLTNGPVALSHVTVTGNTAARDVATIFVGSGVLTISDSTISQNGGVDGVAILNHGGLVVRRSSIAQNIDSLWNVGSATISDTTISGNGGGVMNEDDGSMRLTRTTVTGNSSFLFSPGIDNRGELWFDDGSITDNTFTGFEFVARAFTSGVLGGGLSNEGTAHLSRSTISGNTITEHCTIDYMQSCDESAGSGIFNGGTMDVTNATVANNALDFSCVWNDDDPEDYPDNGCLPVIAGAGGGGVGNGLGGTLTAVGLTVAGNTSGASAGGGIAVTSGTVSLTDSIVSGNTGTPGNDCSGTLALFSYSLLDDPAGCTISADTGSLFDVDPLLGPLANNGGLTQTMALDPASPAVDAGPARKRDGCPKTDQRGVRRPQGAGCDMGAYELEP